MPESEYQSLKSKRQELKNQLTVIEKELGETKSFFETQSFFHDPEVVISIYRNKKKSDQWLGRVRVPDNVLPYFNITDGRRFYISFVICDVSVISNRNNTELEKLAKEAARNKLKQRLSLQYVL